MDEKKTLIIGEVAQAHDGSLGTAHTYIESMSKAGADVVKFQMHIADAESSEYETFRVKFSSQDKTRFDYWKRMEFTIDHWNEIKDHCTEKGVEFMCSPFSIAAVDILESLNVNRYKIASGEINNYLMLEKIAKTGKPILLSTGMSSFQEIDDTLNFLKPFGNSISIFQTTTAYPTGAKEIGFNVITGMLKRYDHPIGLSDHSGKIFPSLAAVTLGASMIEVHGVFNKDMFGPDVKASLTIEEFTQLVEGIRYIDEAQVNKVEKDRTDQFEEMKVMFGKSLAVNKDMKAGDTLTFDDLESKKPANKGLNAKNYQDILGKVLKIDMAKNQFINENDLE